MEVRHSSHAPMHSCADIYEISLFEVSMNAEVFKSKHCLDTKPCFSWCSFGSHTGYICTQRVDFFLTVLQSGAVSSLDADISFTGETEFTANRADNAPGGQCTNSQDMPDIHELCVKLRRFTELDSSHGNPIFWKA